MDYNFSKDLKSIREILGVSQSELAEQIAGRREDDYCIECSEDGIKFKQALVYSTP